MNNEEEIIIEMKRLVRALQERIRWLEEELDGKENKDVQRK